MGLDDGNRSICFDLISTDFLRKSVDYKMLIFNTKVLKILTFGFLEDSARIERNEGNAW